MHIYMHIQICSHVFPTYTYTPASTCLRPLTHQLLNVSVLTHDVSMMPEICSIWCYNIVILTKSRASILSNYNN